MTEPHPDIDPSHHGLSRGLAESSMRAEFALRTRLRAMAVHHPDDPRREAMTELADLLEHSWSSSPSYGQHWTYLAGAFERHVDPTRNPTAFLRSVTDSLRVHASSEAGQMQWRSEVQARALATGLETERAAGHAPLTDHEIDTSLRLPRLPEPTSPATQVGPALDAVELAIADAVETEADAAGETTPEPALDPTPSVVTDHGL